MSALPRGLATTYLVNTLSGLVFPVGDNAPPAASHGWQGEPNAEGTNFIPWLTLSPGNAAPLGGTLSDSQTEWRATYFLTTAGVTRKQAEGVADAARRLMVATARSQITSSSSIWKVLQVRVAAIGGVTRLSQTNPPYYVQTDTFELWLSKEN